MPQWKKKRFRYRAAKKFVEITVLENCFSLCPIVGFGSAPREYVINGVRYVVESRFQKPDYKKLRENTLLNNRIGNYLTSDFADLPSVDTDNIINTEYDCTAAGKEENNAAEKE